MARPRGTGSFPAVLLLHGFARQYVEWANDLARGGFIAVAACWFSGGGGAGVNEVTPPIPCPDIPPLGSGEYPNAVQFEFNLPILIMHGTAVRLSKNTQIAFAREFETQLRANQKAVETAYCDGCGHNTFFTNPHTARW
jgi:hypothetical protein